MEQSARGGGGREGAARRTGSAGEWREEGAHDARCRDAAAQRCVVRCRRAAEIGVDLPKGSETLLIFHVLPRLPPLRSPSPSDAPSPLSRSLFTYTTASQKSYRLSRKYLPF